MNILVTGGAGFIGSHVVDAALAEGHKVIVVDDLSTGRMENVNPEAEFVEGSVEDFEAEAVVKFKAEAILHLAAQASITVSEDRPIHDLLVNTAGTLNVIQAARWMGTRRIVFASTSAVYGDEDVWLTEGREPKPTKPYGISKLAAEMYLRALFPRHVILRLGNVYGPRQVNIGENQVIARMTKHLLEDSPFSIHGDGEQRRDFVYVEDVARAFLAGMGGMDGTYNIGTGQSRSVNEAAQLMSNICQDWRDWLHDDLDDARRDVQMDVSKARVVLGWNAETGLDAGLRKTVFSWRVAGGRA